MGGVENTTATQRSVFTKAEKVKLSLLDKSRDFRKSSFRISCSEKNLHTRKSNEFSFLQIIEMCTFRGVDLATPVFKAMKMDLSSLCCTLRLPSPRLFVRERTLALR